MQVPDYVLYAMNKLLIAGYECYLVGGCVRDMLMGVAPNDYDLTTSALPSEMQAVFSCDKVIETGLKHGTLTVLCDSKPIEITTYRIDGEYDDNRHPRSVSFTACLREDLARRDFTVNAMAMSCDGELVDLFGGVNDLENRVIRSVGNAGMRFSEDGLRILRAMRFAATLGFSVDCATAAAVDSMCSLLYGISAERIHSELIKLIVGRSADKIIARFAVTLSTVLPELTAEQLRDFAKMLPNVPCNAYIRIALMCTRSDNPIQAAASIASRLRFSANERKSTCCYTSLMTQKPTDKITLAGYADRLGYNAVREALLVCGCDDGLKSLCEIQENALPISVRELKINGDDIVALGVLGADVGRLLNYALKAVMSGECSNEHSEILSVIKNILKAEGY